MSKSYYQRIVNDIINDDYDNYGLHYMRNIDINILSPGEKLYHIINLFNGYEGLSNDHMSINISDFSNVYDKCRDIPPTLIDPDTNLTIIHFLTRYGLYQELKNLLINNNINLNLTPYNSLILNLSFYHTMNITPYNNNMIETAKVLIDNGLIPTTDELKIIQSMSLHKHNHVWKAIYNIVEEKLKIYNKAATIIQMWYSYHPYVLKKRGYFKEMSEKWLCHE